MRMTETDIVHTLKEYYRGMHIDLYQSTNCRSGGRVYYKLSKSTFGSYASSTSIVAGAVSVPTSLLLITSCSSRARKTRMTKRVVFRE
jgi:hypothetical protein